MSTRFLSGSRIAALCIGLAMAQPATAQHPETIDLRVDDLPLLTLLESIARQCDRGLVVDRDVTETVVKNVRIFAKDAKWDDAMRLLEDEYSIELSLSKKRIEVIDAKASFRGRLERRYYRIGQLQRGLRDHASDGLGIPYPSTGESSNVFQMSADEPTAVVDLEGLILNSIPEYASTWDREGVEFSFDEDTLIVRHLPEVHDRIAEILVQLERTASRSVVCRVHELRNGVPYRPILDAETFAGTRSDADLVASFVVGDGQRNHHYCGTSRPFIADAETVDTTLDPIVETLRLGLLIEVEPHVTRSGVLANVEIAQCDSPSSSTTAIADASNERLVDIELPRLVSESAGDGRLFPAGGAGVYTLGDRVFAVSFEIITN